MATMQPLRKLVSARWQLLVVPLVIGGEAPRLAVGSLSSPSNLFHPLVAIIIDHLVWLVHVFAALR
jgi:hypothetical protein